MLDANTNQTKKGTKLKLRTTFREKKNESTQTRNNVFLSRFCASGASTKHNYLQMKYRPLANYRVLTA